MDVIVEDEADAAVGRGSVCRADEDSDADADEEARLGFLRDDRRGVVGREDDERCECDGDRECWQRGGEWRWGVRETCRPIAICSIVGRTDAEGGSRKVVEERGDVSSGVEYICMDCEWECERPWRFALGLIERLTETRMREAARGWGEL